MQYRDVAASRDFTVCSVPLFFRAQRHEGIKLSDSPSEVNSLKTCREIFNEIDQDNANFYRYGIGRLQSRKSTSLL